MKISVVIPTYNRSDYLLQTITSILAQTQSVDEIIVIDDGSTDDTADAIKKLNNSIIHYVYQDNTGQNIARDNGVKIAKNNWIALCDSDDLWEPNHIDNILQCHKLHQDAEFIFTNFTEFGSSKLFDNKFKSAPEYWWDGSFYQQNEKIKSYDIKKLLYKIVAFTPIFPSSSCFKRDKYFEFNVISEKLKGLNIPAEDFYTALIFCARAKVASHEDCTVKIRKHDQNFSQSFMNNLLGEITIIKEATHDLQKIIKLNKALITPLILQREMQLLYGYFSAKQYKKYINLFSPRHITIKNSLKYLMSLCLTTFNKEQG